MASARAMAAGANVSALSRELGVRRKLLYQWRDTVRRGGVEASRGVGRPRAGEDLAASVERPRRRRILIVKELGRNRQFQERFSQARRFAGSMKLTIISWRRSDRKRRALLRSADARNSAQQMTSP